ncbi:type 1 glutamine amidotransferase [Jatrophihabitans fulvus]
MSRNRVLVVELDPSDPVGRLGEWLAGAGADLDVRRVHAGDPLPGVDEVDAVVVMGGGMGANDDARHPYLRDVKALLRDAIAAPRPVLGVCLGGQLLAAANGGRVEVNPEGPEIGAGLVAKRSAAAGDPLFDSLPITPDVVQWHYDAVTRLPPGAVQLASSPVCENQAFRLGGLAWGLQFHIETTPEVVASWARQDAASLTDDYPQIDLDRIVARASAVHDDVAEVWAPFAAAFMAVVADPDSAADPAPTAGPADPVAAARAALAAEASAARDLPGPAFLPMPTRRPDGD